MDGRETQAAALLTRLTGLGATFHYDGGIQTTIPAGTELACLDAWLEAWTLLPPDVEQHGTFRASGTADAVVRQFNRDVTYAVFERTDGRQGWVLAMGKGDPALELVLPCRCVREEPSDDRELLGGGQVRCAHEGDLLVVELRARTDRGERLERLGRRAEEGDELGIARGELEPPVVDRDRVDDVPSLDHVPPRDLDDDRLHGAGAYATPLASTVSDTDFRQG